MTQKLEKLINQLSKTYPKKIDLSLSRLSILLERLGNPHLKLSPVIHIAGTNGKGSTLSFIKNILIENSYLVHCYISPHLYSIKERYIIANKQVKEKKLFETYNYIKKINNNNPITYFEFTTAAAFYLFEKEKSDFVILETGLGGRLDATNVVKNPIINIITPISYDHQDFLGNSLTKIANEKLGIIKPNSLVIFSKQKREIIKFAKKKLKLKKNKKIFYGDHYSIDKKSKSNLILKYKNKIYNFNRPQLFGDHQLENASTAIITAFKINELAYKITNNSINKGISKTTWPGRLEKGKLKNIPVYLDGAHNLEGFKKVVSFFKNKKIERWAVLGMLNNKDLKGCLLKLKKIVNGVIAIEIPGESNSFKTKEIKDLCAKLKLECIVKKNIAQSNNYLIKTIKPKEIIILGSLYLVGKIRNLYI